MSERMSQGTKEVLAQWPFDWREWDIVVDLVARRVGMTRRSVANRGAWLLHNNFIDRLWLFDGAYDQVGNTIGFFTRRT